MGCVSTLNERNAHNYANAAVAAQEAGDWESARRNWAKAATNAQLAGMSEKQMAIAYYEYARASGATCFFEESEKYLKESLALDRANNGPIHMSLLELARLKLAQGKYEEANNYFEQLIPIYERQKAVEKVEKNFILNALINNAWNVTHASEKTGLQRTNFQSLMKKHGITLSGHPQSKK